MKTMVSLSFRQIVVDQSHSRGTFAYCTAYALH